MKALDFVVIGASKSGTTTLFEYLKGHPGIYIPPSKDIRFFSSDESYSRGWAPVANEYFSQASSEQLWGCVTPKYMEDPRVPGRMSKSMPQVKLIAILRNPVDRMISHFRQQVRNQKEQGNFENYARNELKPDALERARTLASEVNAVSLCHPIRSEYARILKEFTACFSREQLLVVFTEEMTQNPQKVLDSILSFFGLETGFVPSNLGKRYHTGGSNQRFPGLIPTARGVPILRWLWRSIPRKHRLGFLVRYNTQLNVITEEASPIDPQLRASLVKFYRDDVRELEALICRPVPWSEFHDQNR